MLRVNIHAGAAKDASRYNLIAWLDIGYDNLAPVATYKAVLYQNGQGAGIPVTVEKYPRWSASLWDLVSRSIVLCLREGNEDLVEKLPATVETTKRFAFAEQICALIYHAPGADNPYRRLLGSVSVSQVKRKRGTYVAEILEHAMPRSTTAPFVFQPEVLRPAELILRACAVHLSGKAELPPRPELCFPIGFDKTGSLQVPVHQLVEPARTGLVNWLTLQGASVQAHPTAPQGVVPAQVYQQFLSVAV